MSDIAVRQQFNYGGSKYALVLSMQADDDLHVAFDNTAVIRFEYETELNSLLMTGSLTYVDAYGQIDVFIDRQDITLQFIFAEITDLEDNSIKVSMIPPDKCMVQNMLITNIGILKRNNNQITYKIDFVDTNIYKCMSVIDYSNYKSGPKSIFEILKTCLSRAQLPIDQESFKYLESNDKILYITNGNDTVQTIFKYLLNRLYYGTNNDSALKFIFWNHLKKHYQAFDMSNQQTYNDSDKVILSLMKTDMEAMSAPERHDLATITRFPQNDVFDTFFNIKQETYDYLAGKFNVTTTESRILAQAFNSRSAVNNELIDKYIPQIQSSPGNTYIKHGSDWNNEFATYDRLQRCLFKNNALLIDVAGDFARLPGQLVTVIIDRPKQIELENSNEMKDLKSRYIGFEGPWFATRVHSIIELSIEHPRFRQYLALSRNFKTILNNNRKII